MEIVENFKQINRNSYRGMIHACSENLNMLNGIYSCVVVHYEQSVVMSSEFLLGFNLFHSSHDRLSNVIM